MYEGHALAWTPERVAAGLIEAFRILPSVPVYSPTRVVLQTAGGPARPPGLVLLMAAVRMLDRDAQVQLLSWARARAHGESVRELCRAHGWPRTSFDERRKASLQVLADGLERARREDRQATASPPTAPTETAATDAEGEVSVGRREEGTAV